MKKKKFKVHLSDGSGLFIDYTHGIDLLGSG